MQLYALDGTFLYEVRPDGVPIKHIHLGKRLVASVTGSVPVYTHLDALGSVVRRSASNGVQLGDPQGGRSIIEPYGSLSGGSWVQGPGFAGHVADLASGLTYMQQRYQDPGAMRFLSVDPVHVDPGTGENFNRYWYANNNPYKFVDPDGRDVRCAGSTCQVVPIGGNLPTVPFPRPDGFPASVTQPGPNGTQSITTYGEGNSFWQRVFDPGNEQSRELWSQSAQEITRRAQ